MKWILILSLFLSGVSQGRDLSPHVEIEWLPETETIQPGTRFWTAVRMQMEEGWHVYWRNPGDSGKEPRFDWVLPEGIEQTQFLWPTPRRIPFAHLINYGYENEIFFPVEFTVDKVVKGNLTLNAHARWVVCKKVCIPGKADLYLNVRVSQKTPKKVPWMIPYFEATRQQIPVNNQSIQTEYLREGNSIILSVKPTEKKQWVEAEFFPFKGEDVLPVGQMMELTDDGADLYLSRDESVEITEAPELLKGVLALTHREPDGALVRRAFTIESPGKTQVFSLKKFLEMLLFAFLGGLILNLMPCVFPVLSIKLMAFLKGGSDASKVKKESLFYIAGVFATFTLLASGLILLRSGGAALGWGFQLQSPVFIGILGGVFTLLSLSLFGVFELGARLMATGHGLASLSGWKGSFFSGVLAVVVATPCTAPLMGVAIGYALTQDAIFSLSIFEALAFGFAFPYFLIWIFPSFIKKFPKPGAWMERMKVGLGIPLFLTVVWLGWVLSFQTEMMGVGIYSGAVVLLILWTFFQSRKKSFFLGVVFIFAVLSAGLSFVPGKSHQPETLHSHGFEWNSYSAHKLKKWRKEKRPLFLDVTAAWCVTCQVNEKLIFGSDEVIEFLRENNVRLVQADWTNQDPQITKLLSQFGRQGVPLYVYYPVEGDPILLPEVLTPQIFLDLLKPKK
ncbi:MAG: thiol:disulfide interchange protein [Bdellovibrionaceae bacterium]|nr:thiol:disulfide interchange protein [Pseudobdellovibrionaceae bacterium]|tara:strand:- start:5054 stop:7081 length:2028 start_codon:yes stop_codon:yes gene_type:complete